MDGRLPEDGLAIFPNLHLAAVCGEHTIDMHLHLCVVDTLLGVVYHDARIVDVKVEGLCGVFLAGGGAVVGACGLGVGAW